MALKSYKPTTPGQRGLVLIDRSELWKGRPVKSLTEGLTGKGGRNNTGRITMRRRGGRVKRLYRVVDFRRAKFDVPAKVIRIEYDPNRTAFIALIGYADGEQLTNEALIREQYRGIRPAPGYPACPDHSEKPMLFELLDATNATGITLTDSFAMLPTAAVSGFYFAHPDSAYFGVARIGQDQLENYAERRGVDIDTAARWLRPNLD